MKDAGENENRKSDNGLGEWPDEALMVQRMAENDKMVTRCLKGSSFQRTAFPMLARDTPPALHNPGPHNRNA